ncbi:class III lanthionine synthetase LanKC N-terminal domain-containing protein [Salipiger sp. CCB-MM3]|uniref:class III lanthionine synthetase LanKC N-terminal domain-containing protein n=1 Tax=Salipiger sp. CCB-MM3 TaxID=1792508 RepID=UPI00187D73A4|nr:protein kinase [Salipiger sp. CCB-MM3]
MQRVDVPVSPVLASKDDLAKEREAAWRDLVEEFLPVVPRESGWRYRRVDRADYPSQGWKLHVSATVPTAIEVFRRCAPVLAERGVYFKSVKSLRILARLNSAIPFGFSQIGKFITVYPRGPEQAVELAALLHDLTKDFEAPAVPFDECYMPGSSVHYRYGAFSAQEMELEDGSMVGAIRDPQGVLVPDLREPGKAAPDWARNPFPGDRRAVTLGTKLQTDYLCYEAMMQRGKGGVYRAVDIKCAPARLCVVKEGRRHGETDWTGSDGRTLVEREEMVLRHLEGSDCASPAVLDSFVIDRHRYLVIEHIKGAPLLQACSDPTRKLPLDVALAYAAGTASLVAALHSAGWVWRDLKPANILVEETGRLRPVDFEGAIRSTATTQIPWGTPSYMPPEIHEGPVTGSHVPEDLFGLGATIHQLLTSWLMHRDEPADLTPERVVTRPPVGTLRKGVPLHVRDLVLRLMDADPLKRPEAAEAHAVLSDYERVTLPVPTLPKRESAIVRRVREKLWKEAQDMILREPELA